MGDNGTGYKKITESVRTQSTREKGTEDYVIFKEASIMQPSSNVIMSSNIRPGDAFEVMIDTEKGMIKLLRVDNGNGAKLDSLLIAAKVGGVAIKGYFRIYFRCNTLCEQLGIPTNRHRVPVFPLTNGFELKYIVSEKESN